MKTDKVCLQKAGTQRAKGPGTSDEPEEGSTAQTMGCLKCSMKEVMVA